MAVDGVLLFSIGRALNSSGLTLADRYKRGGNAGRERAVMEIRVIRGVL